MKYISCNSNSKPASNVRIVLSIHNVGCTKYIQNPCKENVIQTAIGVVRKIYLDQKLQWWQNGLNWISCIGSNLLDHKG